MRSLYLFLAILTSAMAIFAPIDAWAANCIELNNCEFNNVMERVVYPYRILIGDYIYIITWGSILGILYIRNHNAMLTSFVGVILASLFVGTDTYISSATGQAFYWGWILVISSIGMALFFILKTKTVNP